MIPVGAYLSWAGKLYEGLGVEPDIAVDWAPETSRADSDPQLQSALTAVLAL